MRPNNRMLGTRIDLSAIVIPVAAAIMLLAIMDGCEAVNQLVLGHHDEMATPSKLRKKPHAPSKGRGPVQRAIRRRVHGERRRGAKLDRDL
jgi:hypothetical protein